MVYGNGAGTEIRLSRMLLFIFIRILRNKSSTTSSVQSTYFHFGIISAGAELLPVLALTASSHLVFCASRRNTSYVLCKTKTKYESYNILVMNRLSTIIIAPTRLTCNSSLAGSFSGDRVHSTTRLEGIPLAGHCRSHGSCDRGTYVHSTTRAVQGIGNVIKIDNITILLSVLERIHNANCSGLRNSSSSVSIQYAIVMIIRCKKKPTLAPPGRYYTVRKKQQDLNLQAAIGIFFT